MQKLKTQKKLLLSVFILLVTASLMLVNIYGLISVQPVQKEMSEIKEVLYDSNSFVVCIHMTNNYVYIMEPSIYQSYAHNWSTEFFAKGDYAEIHNKDGYISNTSNADFINITMHFSLPDNWTRLVIYREDRFSTTEEQNVTGVLPGNIKGNISFLFGIYDFNGSNLFADTHSEYVLLVSPATYVIEHNVKSFAFTHKNATKFGLVVSKRANLILNYFLYNITTEPTNLEYYNFSVWINFGLGYTVYKNITFIKSYTQYQNMTQYLLINLGFSICTFLLILACAISENAQERIIN